MLERGSVGSVCLGKDSRNVRSLLNMVSGSQGEKLVGGRAYEEVLKVDIGVDHFGNGRSLGAAWLRFGSLGPVRVAPKQAVDRPVETDIPELHQRERRC